MSSSAREQASSSSSTSSPASASKTRIPFQAGGGANLDPQVPQQSNRSPIYDAMMKAGNQDTAPRKPEGMFGSKKLNDSRRAKQQGKTAQETGVVQKSTENEIPSSISPRPVINPSDSRSLDVQSSDEFQRQYRRLMSGVITVNNIKTELRLQERYEKPKYKRQRLRSARHRRRFANEVGIRVAAVLRAKSQGM